MVPDHIVVSFANSFTTATLSCTTFVGFTGSCSSPTSHSNNVSGTLSSSSMGFTVTGLTTPLSAPTDYTTISSFDASGFQIDQSLTDIIFSIECTMPCKSCTNTLTLCQSCYTNTQITSFVLFYANGNSCLESCPSSTF